MKFIERRDFSKPAKSFQVLKNNSKKSSDINTEPPSEK